MILHVFYAFLHQKKSSFLERNIEESIKLTSLFTKLPEETLFLMLSISNPECPFSYLLVFAL